MWLDAPDSSSLPHFEGHHGLSVPLGMEVAVCACAVVTGASENLPCIAPASAAPAAPASPAVRSKVRRSVSATPPFCCSPLTSSSIVPSQVAPMKLGLKIYFRHAPPPLGCCPATIIRRLKRERR